MKKLILLSGKASCGKTTALKILIALLLQAGARIVFCRKKPLPTAASLWQQIQAATQSHAPQSDISVILEIQGVRVGIRTEGDTIGTLWDAVAFFEKNKCDIGVAACHPEHLQRSLPCLAAPWASHIIWSKKTATAPALFEQDNTYTAHALFADIMTQISQQSPTPQP